MLVLLQGITVTEVLTPATGVITLSHPNGVVGSEIIKKADGTTLTEGSEYTVTGSKGFFADDQIATTETEALSVTYTYVEKVLGGASEMALSDSFDSEEKAIDSSFRKITIIRGSSTTFNFNDVAFTGDISQLAALTGSVTTGTAYSRFNSGISKTVTLVVQAFAQEGEVAYGTDDPTRAYIIEDARPTGVDITISSADKTLNMNVQKYRIVDYA
jgi:hypothetical protein